MQEWAAWGLRATEPASALTLLVTGVLTWGGCVYDAIRASRQEAKSPIEGERERERGREQGEEHPPEQAGAATGRRAP